MVYIVGLGNPGIKYAETRHNVGFKVVELIAEKSGVTWQEKSKLNAEIARGSVGDTGDNQATLIKPLSFMNESGLPVRAVIEYFQDFEVGESDQKLDWLYVAFDDLDLEVGTHKLQFGKGPHGHNGLNSLYQHLGTNQFWHVRIGVDGRGGERLIPPDRYVLQQFEKNELQIMKSMVEQASQDLVKLTHASI